MKRKVIQLAGRTLVVSLPMDWASKYNIKKGDDVEVDDGGSYLKICKNIAGSYGEKKAHIDLRNGSRTTTRAIISGFYKQGYDEIVITYNSKEVYDAIIEKRKEVLLGFTIHEIAKDKLLLGSFMNDSPKEFENSLRRAFLVTISMGENLLDAIKNKDYKNLKEIRHGENTNNQLTSFCERLINKGFVDPNKASFYYVVCWNLEKVCDPYRDIIFLMEEHKNFKFSNDTLKLFDIVNKFLKRYYDSIFNYNLQKVVQLAKDKEDIAKESGKIYNGKSEFECRVLNYLFEIAALASNFSGPSSALNTDKLLMSPK